MALRFWRRIKIAPGLTLNLSKSGGSLSFGPRGAKYTIGPRGRRATVGLPGTGLFYTQTTTRQRSKATRQAPPIVPAEDRLNMSFFKRLTTPTSEKAFVDGCRELARGDYQGALQHLQGSTHLDDGAFLAGFLRLRESDVAGAIPLLEKAVAHHSRLGRYFDKYGLTLTLNLPVTEETEAHVGATLRGALLTLVEAYQIAEHWDKAYKCLQRLRKLEPDDAVILLSLIDLVWEANYGNKETCQHIVKLTKAVENKSPVHTMLLLYKVRALNVLDMHTAARSLATETLRRRKNRPDSVMNSLRYERAIAYGLLGQAKRARADLERIYAADPEFEDVAKRLRL